jgi:phage gpG-like protein
MKLTLTMNTTAGRRRLDLAGASMSNVQRALSHFNRYMRGRIKDRFEAEGPGWAPLAKSTDKRLAHTFVSRVTAHGKVRQTTRLKSLIARNVATGVMHELARATRSTGGGALGEAVRRHLGGKVRFAAELRATARDLTRSALGRLKLKKRALLKHKMLGKLANAFRSKLSKTELVITNLVPWAGVHNEGGVVGHGAHVPERKFAYFEDEDAEVLAMLVLDDAASAAKAE